MSSKENNTKKYSSRSILYTALMRHKKGLLLVIFISLMSSTLAWFYLNLTVGVKINGEVESWNVSTGESADYTFGFERLYPGKSYTSEEKKVPITNSGSTDAILTLTVKDIYLFGEKLDKGDDYQIVPVPVQAQVQVGEDETNLRDTEGIKYVITGFPFEVSITFPTTRLTRNESARVNFTLNWEENGDLKPAKDGENFILDADNNKVPKCLNAITNDDILRYVSGEIDKYDKIGIEVVQIDDSAEGEELELDGLSITTCDIIDTYFGSNSDDFKARVADLDSNKIVKDFYYDRDEATGEIIESFPIKDLYIELSLTITQAGVNNTSNSTE